MKRTTVLYLFVSILICHEIDRGKSFLSHDIEHQPIGFDQKNTNEEFQLNTETILKRDKRYLLFTNGGISKIVLGFLTPVETRDRVNWRTLNLGYNLQAQYIPIPNSTYLWQFFARDLRQQRQLYDQKNVHFKDLTRELIYEAMELFHNSKGKPGHQCLLKSICDLAAHPIVRSGSIFEEIIHLILTPNTEETINDDYKNARLAGERGADCTDLYNCQFGDGFLDRFSYIN